MSEQAAREVVLWLCQQCRLSLPQALAMPLAESARWLKAARAVAERQSAATAR
ncbi:MULTISPECIES: hypothetical protein [Tepidimonas]|uniref:hypothetical protein n=1 Tax=Tepidimonas TaxID=114248 RepID=UPI001375A373|nr:MULTISPECIES: hypothetical protein [Tepidimonas]